MKHFVPLAGKGKVTLSLSPGASFVLQHRPVLISVESFEYQAALHESDYFPLQAEK